MVWIIKARLTVIELIQYVVIGFLCSPDTKGLWSVFPMSLLHEMLYGPQCCFTFYLLTKSRAYINPSVLLEHQQKKLKTIVKILQLSNLRHLSKKKAPLCLYTAQQTWVCIHEASQQRSGEFRIIGLYGSQIITPTPILHEYKPWVCIHEVSQSKNAGLRICFYQ